MQKVSLYIIFSILLISLFANIEQLKVWQISYHGNVGHEKPGKVNFAKRKGLLDSKIHMFQYRFMVAFLVFILSYLTVKGFIEYT